MAGSRKVDVNRKNSDTTYVPYCAGNFLGYFPASQPKMPKEMEADSPGPL